MTIEVSQSVNQRNRKRRGGNENKEDSSLFFLTSFLLTSPVHILIITVSVRPDLLSAGNFCQRAQQREHHLFFDKCSVIAVPLNTILVFH